MGDCDQIELRPLKESELEYMRYWRPRMDVDRWLETHIEDITEKEQKDWWEVRKDDATQQWFTIWQYEPGPGGCGYFIEKSVIRGWAQMIDIDLLQSTCEVGVVVPDLNYRRRGIAQRALELLLQECKEKRIYRIEAHILASNIASMRLFMAAGFKPDIYMPNHCERGDVIRWVKRIS